MMEIKYSEQEFIDAYNAVMQAENTDAFPVHTWARYAKILADVCGDAVFEQVVVTEAEDYGGHA